MPHRRCLVSHEPWSKGVKEYLERAVHFEIRTGHDWRLSDLREENLSKDIIKKDDLQPRREVGVDTIFS
jgi:hypothetical protein